MTATSHDINTFLTQHPHWTFQDDAIHTTHTFATFPDAIAAINTIAELAEQADHHPDLTNSYTTVGIRLTSHDSNAVTARDLALAAPD